MGKIHIENPERLRELLRDFRQKVRDRMEESILAAARGVSIRALAGVTTANVAPTAPPTADDILESIRAAAGAMPPRPSFYDLLEGQGYKIDPEPMPSLGSMLAMRYPIYPMFPSALTRIYIDPAAGCDEFPTLRAELTLPDTPEFRRAWRLYNLNPSDPRRLKRCVRLFRRLAAQAIAE